MADAVADQDAMEQAIHAAEGVVWRMQQHIELMRRTQQRCDEKLPVREAGRAARAPC